jgi:hypothetical protein
MDALFFSTSLLGPPSSSRVLQAHGGAAMLFHLAALWALFVFFYRDDLAVARRAEALVPEEPGI